MSHRLSEHQVRQLRVQNQLLGYKSLLAKLEVENVVNHLCGIQAQDLNAAALALWARSNGIIKSDVESALYQTRTIVRTWCMRGTLHLVSADDYVWLIDLLGQFFIKSSRGRREQLGLDEATGKKSVAKLKKLLAENGPLTRVQIVKQLSSQGIHLVGQAAPHLLRLAALQGAVCYGPDQEGEPTYVLVSDWISSKPGYLPDDPLAELAQRYLSSYAPATPQDFSTWSGLSMSQAQSAWKRILNHLVEVNWNGSTGWILSNQQSLLGQVFLHDQIVCLLPRYDTYLLGYQNRDLIIDEQFRKRIYPGGGLLYPAVLVNGRVSGLWGIKTFMNRIEVIVEPFEELVMDVQRKLMDEIDRLSIFMGKKIDFIFA